MACMPNQPRRIDGWIDPTSFNDLLYRLSRCAVGVAVASGGFAGAALSDYRLAAPAGALVGAVVGMVAVAVAHNAVEDAYERSLTYHPEWHRRLREDALGMIYWDGVLVGRVLRHRTTAPSGELPSKLYKAESPGALDAEAFPSDKPESLVQPNRRMAIEYLLARKGYTFD